MVQKETHTYYCCYCDNHYMDNNWTLDHIIPIVLGGIDSYQIISCRSCNNKIGSGIEQVCAQSVDFRHAIIGLSQRGIKIKTRHKKEFIPISNRIGFSSDGHYAKLGYNPISNSHILKVFGKIQKINSFEVSKDKKLKKFLVFGNSK